MERYYFYIICILFLYYIYIDPRVYSLYLPEKPKKRENMQISKRGNRQYFVMAGLQREPGPHNRSIKTITEDTKFIFIEPAVTGMY